MAFRYGYVLYFLVSREGGSKGEWGALLVITFDKLSTPTIPIFVSQLIFQLSYDFFLLDALNSP